MKRELLRILYILLFTISLVNSNNIKDEPQVNRRVSKHHRRVKSALRDSEVVATPTDNDDLEVKVNAKTAQDPPTDMEQEENEEFTDNEKIGRSGEQAEQNRTENNERSAEDDIPKTLFVGGLRRRANSDGTDDNEDNDEEYSRKENDSNSDNIENEDDSGEVLVYSPNSRTLSQDIVLDLKARTGNDPSIESNLRIDLASSEIESRIGPFSEFDPYMRSGYDPSDNPKDIPNTSDYQAFDANLFNWPNSASGNHPMPQSHRANNANQGSFQAQLPNYLSLFSPLYKELMNPNSNSPSAWEASSSGQFRNTMTPHFGPNYPNDHVYNPKMFQKCSVCQAATTPSSVHNYRRSIDAGPNTFETANGRAIEFEPVGSNSYPLVPYKDSEEAKGILDALSREAFKSQESNLIQNFPSSVERRQGSPEINPLVNVVKPYFQGIPIILNQRVMPGSVRLQRLIG